MRQGGGVRLKQELGSVKDFIFTVRKNFERGLLYFLEDKALKSLHGCTDILFRLGLDIFVHSFTMGC